MAKPEKYERHPVVDGSGGMGFGQPAPMLAHHHKEDKLLMTRREKQEVALIIIIIVSVFVGLLLLCIGL